MPRVLFAALLSLIATGGQAESCKQFNHFGDDYTVCAVDDASRIGLWLLDETGEIYGDFRALNEELAQDGLKLAFAMNGGMYHDDRRAVGLFINDQGQQQSLMTKEGPGNFGLLPNGVFCVAGDTAIVMQSLEFQDAGLDCRIATQSGPMLVINGQLHPKFLADSPSKKWRNGIGVDAAGTTYFAISDNTVRFHDFATLFRDVLKAPNALFLDGTISRLFADELSREDSGARMGPILGVVAKH